MDNVSDTRNTISKKRSKSLSTNNLFQIYENNNIEYLNNNIKLNDSEINKTIERCFKNLQELKHKFFGSQKSNFTIFNPSSHKMRDTKLENNTSKDYIKYLSSYNLESSPNFSNFTEIKPVFKKRRLSNNSFNSFNNNRTQNNVINFNTSMTNNKSKNTNFKENKKIKSNNNNNFNNYRKKYPCQLYLNKQYCKIKYNNNNFDNFESYQNKILHNFLNKKNSQIENLINENKILKFHIEKILSEKEEISQKDYLEIIKLKKVIFEYQKKNKILESQLNDLSQELLKYKQNHNNNISISSQSIVKDEETKCANKNRNSNININNNKNKDFQVELVLIKNKQLTILNNQYKSKIKDLNDEINSLNNIIKDKNNIIISLKKYRKESRNKIINKTYNPNFNDISKDTNNKNINLNEDKDIIDNINTLIDENETNRKEIEILKKKLKFIDNIECKYKELISKRSVMSMTEDENKKINSVDDMEKNEKAKNKKEKTRNNEIKEDSSFNKNILFSSCKKEEENEI